jgi:hypothetical protein
MGEEVVRRGDEDGASVEYWDGRDAGCQRARFYLFSKQIAANTPRQPEQLSPVETVQLVRFTSSASCLPTSCPDFPADGDVGAGDPGARRADGLG